MIVIEPGGGLCNYLRVVFSYYALALEKKEPLVVIWYKTNVCPGYFLDYFKPLENVTFDYNNNKNYKINYSGCMILKDYLPKYDKLELLPQLKDIIMNKCKLLENNYIAVHIRRTDHSVLAKKNNCYSEDIDFINFINRESVNTNTNLYIATDNKATFHSFKNKYKNLVKFEYHNTNEILERHTTLKDAIIDLYMCVYSNTFMGSGWSSFTDLIHELRQIENRK
jgi:hypothetical protein